MSLISGKMVGITRFIVFVFLLSLSSIYVHSETFYMANESCNNTWPGNETHPVCDLQTAFNLMSGGDTLIIEDGVYVGEENTIYPWEYPPSGNETMYTVIKARNSGEVIFDGEGQFKLINLNGNGMDPRPEYLQFEGLIFKNSYGEGVSIDYANYIKFFKCGFSNASADGLSNSPFFVRYVEYLLLEDCYAWGEGKYKFFILDSNYVILRRCVERYDNGISTSGYHSSFRIYSSNHVELQNCIALDTIGNFSLIQNTNDTYELAGGHFLIWSGGVNGPNDDVHIRGFIGLNNPQTKAYILQNSYSPQNNTIENSVFWDIGDKLWTRLEVVEGTLFEHLTLGISKGGLLTGEYGNGIIARNNIIYNATTYGLQWTNNPNNSSDYNALYSNGYNYGNGASAKPNDYSLENENEINPFINSLKYLPRIENNSDLSGKASDGGDIGANILYKIGRDGTLWGEDGYNETTNKSLWPFPNENIIKEHMQTYFYTNGTHNLTGNRGFALNTTDLYGGPRTLTSYIWEYLGNSCPDEICTYDSPYNDADLNTDNIINSTEVRYYISEWIGGSATIGDLTNVIEIWKNGGTY